MELKTIDKGLTVSPQIAAADVAKIKKEGFRSIICNRPDGEGADQPTFAEIEKAAKKAGLEIRYLPVVSGKVQDADATQFGEALSEMPKPVFAYCRTGTRSPPCGRWTRAQKAPRCRTFSPPPGRQVTTCRAWCAA